MIETLLRWASAEDLPALRALFERVFDCAISSEEWRWKYPQPTGHSLVALRAGQALAHYGGQPRRLLGLGEPLTAMQIGDSMVDPAARGTGGRNGLFSRIVRQFTEAVTQPAGTHAFTFGFPSPRATRLGELLGIYVRLDRLEQLVWTADDAQNVRSGGASGASALSAARIRACGLAALAPLCKRLWALQRRALGAEHLIGVRDGDWLKTRYLSRPGVTYEGLVARDRWRRPHAALVFRRHAEMLEVIDLLGHPSGYPALLQALCRGAADEGRSAVFAWLTPAAQVGLPAPLGRELLLQVNLAGPQAAAQAERFGARCWMTAGDTDYR